MTQQIQVTTPDGSFHSIDDKYTDLHQLIVSEYIKPLINGFKHEIDAIQKQQIYKLKMPDRTFKIVTINLVLSIEEIVTITEQ